MSARITRNSLGVSSQKARMRVIVGLGCRAPVVAIPFPKMGRILSLSASFLDT